MFLFRKPTVDSVLAGFRKTVDELRGIAGRNVAKSQKLEDTITALRIARDAAGHEALRAHKIADKIDELIS